MIFDTHAHYLSHRFDSDRAELLSSLPGKGVCAVVECGVDLDTSRAAAALAREFPFVYAAAGIHPESLIDEDTSTVARFAGDWRAELREIEPLLEDERVVAVGECGLDHHWPVPRDAQLELLEAQLILAHEHDLPVLLHDREAHADMYELLRKHRPRGVLHCYSGSADDAKWLCAQGLYLGFGGTATFKNARRVLEAASIVPEEQFVLETDCPYMAPEPMRGKRNDSSLITYVAEAIASARGTTAAHILEVSERNARRLFGLDA